MEKSKLVEFKCALAMASDRLANSKFTPDEMQIEERDKAFRRRKEAREILREVKQ